jgi:hypothetical protein
MRWRRLGITILIIAPVLALLAYGFTRDAHYIVSPLIAKPAAPFTVALFDGRKLTLDDLRGKAVFVNFWASWCVPAVRKRASSKPRGRRPKTRIWFSSASPCRTPTSNRATF